MQSTPSEQPSEQPSESSDNESEESWRPSDESSSDESSSGESDGGEELVEQPVNASREWCVAHWTQPAFEHTPKKGAVEKIPDRFLKEGHIMVTETGNILELAYPNGADIQALLDCLAAHPGSLEKFVGVGASNYCLKFNSKEAVERVRAMAKPEGGEALRPLLDLYDQIVDIVKPTDGLLDGFILRIYDEGGGIRLHADYLGDSNRYTTAPQHLTRPHAR